MSGLSGQTKSVFRTMITAVRTKLLADLAAACEQRYSLGARNRSKLNLDAQTAKLYETLDAWLTDPARIHDKRERNLEALVRERAYTLVNRLVILMQLEQRGLRKVRLVSQGVQKSPFQTERGFFFALMEGDDQGMTWVLQQVWDQLALELPALFTRDEVQECVPIPGTTLLWLLDQLNAPELVDAWRDDTTLGWLYQFWNDPDREAVDAKLNTTSGKVEAHEIAAKTQLFTERYMVEWLVQNSLGALWLSICKKRGREPAATTLIKELTARREVWNARIAAGEVAATEALPVGGAEIWWQYYVPQDIMAGLETPERLQEIRVLDPAMGSGHFLVYVFDFLWELYLDQARLDGENYTSEQIIDWILGCNLHGIDIDSRAVQIAAAALYIKVQERSPGYHIQRLQLVASDLGIAHLAADHPSVLAFAGTLETEVGIDRKLSLKLIQSLRGAEYMGSLLQIGDEIDRIIESTRILGTTTAGPEAHERILAALRDFIRDHDQGEDLGLRSLADQLGKGLRLIELLGMKYDVVVANPPYLGIAKAEQTYAEAIGDKYPISKTDLYGVFIERCLQMGRKNVRIAMVTMQNFMFLGSFLELRELIFRQSRVAAVAHLGAYAFQELRDHALAAMFILEAGAASDHQAGLYQRYLVPKDKAGLLVNQGTIYTFPQSRFAEIPGSPMIYWWPEEFRQVYLQAKKLGETGVAELRQGLATSMNNRFLRYPFEVKISDIEMHTDFSQQQNVHCFNWQPYIKGAAGKRWFEELTDVILWKHDGLEVKAYASYLYTSASRTIKSQDMYFRQGLAFSYIGTNGFLCRLRKNKSIFDVSGSSIFCKDPEKMQVILSSNLSGYVSQSINPTINNQVGDIENLPVLDFIKDHKAYLSRAEALYDHFFASTESNLEYAYEHLDSEVFEVEEARIRDEIDKEILAHFSRETAAAIYREIGESVFDFPVWDGTQASIPPDFAAAYQDSSSVEELCRCYRLHPDSILAIKDTFGLVHEAQRQDEVFKHLSWAIGVLLGRFDAQTGGLVDLAAERLARHKQKADSTAPKGHKHGLLYLTALDGHDGLDRKLDANCGSAALETLRSILAYKHGNDEAARLWDKIQAVLVLEGRQDWKPAQLAKRCLGSWIREEAFDRHLALYENRPIYFPLVSAKKNFFAWVNIHAWTDNTLSALLANYLKPDYTVLESRVRRLREERSSVKDTRKQNALEDEIDWLDTLREELAAFIALVTQLAERGPAPDLQEVEAPFVMDLDDGVMVNSAALHELLNPLWKKKPEEWWTSLAKPAGKKDFDWSHLAMRYWPARVFEKVKKDPSLAVAHSDYGAYKGRDLFEELHPAAAEKWRKQQGKAEPEVKDNSQPELEMGH